MAVLYTVDAVLNLNWANEDGSYPIADYVFLDGDGDVHLPAIANGSMGNIWWVINKGTNTIPLFTTGVELISLAANTAVCIQLKSINPLDSLNCWSLAASVNLPLIPALNQMSQIAGGGLEQSYNGKLDNVSSIEYVSSGIRVTEFISGKLFLFTASVDLELVTPPDSSIGCWAYLKNGSRGSVTISTNSINTQFDTGDSLLVLESGDACTLMYTGLSPQPPTSQPKRFFEVVNRYSQQSNLLQSALVLLSAPTQKVIPTPVDTGNTPQNIITFNTNGTVYAVVLNYGSDSFNTYTWNGVNFVSLGAAVGTGSNPSSITTYKVSPIGGPQYISITNYNSDTFSTYVWNGAAFAPVGVPVATGVHPQDMTSFRVGNIPYISILNSGDDTIVTYAWNGTAFASIGSVVPSTGNPKSITSFVAGGVTYIAVTSLTDNSLSVYVWRATTLLSIGTTVTSAGPGMMLSYPIGVDNYVSMVDSTSAKFATYRSDGATLTLIGEIATDLDPVGISTYTYNGSQVVSVVSRGSNKINSYQWNGSAYTSILNSTTAGQPSSITGYAIGSGTYVSITTQATNRLTTYQWLPTTVTKLPDVSIPLSITKDLTTYMIGNVPAMSILSVGDVPGAYKLISYRWDGTAFVNNVSTIQTPSEAQTLFTFSVSGSAVKMGVVGRDVGGGGSIFVANWNGSAFVYGGQAQFSGWSFYQSTCFYINGVPHICVTDFNTARMLVLYWNDSTGLFVSIQAITTSALVTSLTSYVMGGVQRVSITSYDHQSTTVYTWNGYGFTEGTTTVLTGGLYPSYPSGITSFNQFGTTYISIGVSTPTGSQTGMVTLKWNATTSTFDIVNTLNIGAGGSFASVDSFTIGYSIYVGLLYGFRYVIYQWDGGSMSLVADTILVTDLSRCLAWIPINNVPYIVYPNYDSLQSFTTLSFNSDLSLSQIGDIATDALPSGITSYQINGIMYLSAVCKTSNTINTYKWVNGAPAFVSNVSTDAGPSWIISYKIGADVYLSVTNTTANTMGTYRWNGVTFSPVGSNLATGTSPQQLVGYQIAGVIYISVSNYTSNDISTYYWTGAAFATVGAASATQTGLTGIAVYYYPTTDTTYVYASSALDSMIETFSYAKANFVPTGTPISTGGTNPSDLVSYNISGETYLGLVNMGSSNLSTFKWNGTTAVALGDPVPTGAFPTALVQYSAGGIPTISVVNSGDGSYNTYRWDGSRYFLSGSFKTVLTNPFGIATFTNSDNHSLVSITNPSFNSFTTYEDEVASEQVLSPDILDGISISFTDQDQVIPSVGVFTFYAPNPLPKIYFLQCVAKSPFAIVTLKFGEGADSQSITINNQSGAVAVQVTSTGRVNRLFQPVIPSGVSTIRY